MALTKLMLHKDNLLLLDEPTNHLDMDSREVLEKALENFPGTILAISHDRYFINRFATRVAVMENQSLVQYLGNYDDYYEKVNREQPPDGTGETMTRTAMDKEKKKTKAAEQRQKDLVKALKAAELAVEKAEKEKADMEEQLSSADLWLDPEKAEKLTRAYQQKQQEITELYEEWERLEEAVQA